jgi:asparagine synthase (glutamine-hydrolysing)
MRNRHHRNQLIDVLKQVTSKYLHMPLLLSGGLDSTIICSLIKPKLTMVVFFGDHSEDLTHSRTVAQVYSKSHMEINIDFLKFKSLAAKVVKILRTFDPIEVRNSSVLYAGIKEVKNLGYSDLVTGDGADELFAGYNYLLRYYSEPRILEKVLRELWENMTFASKDIGAALGINIHTPYLEEPMISFAKSLDCGEKIGEKSDDKWGKYILRTTFEDKLGGLVWRKKMALEHGSKMSSVSRMVEKNVSKKSFELTKKQVSADKVALTTKEQMYYYSIYRSFFPPPYLKSIGSTKCPYCFADIGKSIRYCQTCGSFPVEAVQGSPTRGQSYAKNV